MTHICVGKLTIIGSDNGLSPERRQAIIWTNAGILLIGPLGTNFNEILIENQTFSKIGENTFENVVCEMLFIASRPQCVKGHSHVRVWTMYCLVSCRGQKCLAYLIIGYASQCPLQLNGGNPFDTDPHIIQMVKPIMGEPNKEYTSNIILLPAAYQ